MADYLISLKSDLVEQFKGKPHIEDLMAVIAIELQEVWNFFEQLRVERSVSTSVGKQLDGVGDIAVLTRMEAGRLAGNPIPFDVIDDDTYRQFLLYKIMKNTCDCTYPFIIKAFRMFWKYPLYYSEDPEQPATMIFDTGELSGEIFTTPLFRVPLLRAAGVTLKLIARTSTPIPPAEVRILSGVGYAITETYLPDIERDYQLSGKLRIGTCAGYWTCTEDRTPVLEREMLFDQGQIRVGSAFGSYAEDGTPILERKISFDPPLNSGSVVHSVMETPINGLTPPKISRRQRE